MMILPPHKFRFYTSLGPVPPRSSVLPQNPCCVIDTATEMHVKLDGSLRRGCYPSGCGMLREHGFVVEALVLSNSYCYTSPRGRKPSKLPRGNMIG